MAVSFSGPLYVLVTCMIVGVTVVVVSSPRVLGSPLVGSLSGVRPNWNPPSAPTVRGTPMLARLLICIVTCTTTAG